MIEMYMKRMEYNQKGAWITDPSLKQFNHLNPPLTMTILPSKNYLPASPPVNTVTNYIKKDTLTVHKKTHSVIPSSYSVHEVPLY